MNRANVDLVVANTVRRGHYMAWVVSIDKTCGPAYTKTAAVNKLIGAIGQKLI